MEKALLQAESAFKAGEVPIGAVAVHQKTIIAEAHNQVEFLRDATAHAEILCLKKASAHLQNWRLTGVTLYTTVEPCAMCLGAILLSRIERLVWGAPDIRHGAAGSWVNLLEKPHPTHSLQTQSGLLEERSAELLKTFFKGRRCKNCSKN